MPRFFRFTGWLRHVSGSAVFVASALAVFGQGTFVYQSYYTSNPDPNFPWDYEGQRVLSLYPVSMTIDLNQDGTSDYVIATGGAQSTLGFYIYGLSGQNMVWADAPFDSDFAVALSRGESIGPDTGSVYNWFGPQFVNGTWLGSTFTASVGDLTAGYYTGVDSAYCGLQMEVDGEIHYGGLGKGGESHRVKRRLGL